MARRKKRNPFGLGLLSLVAKNPPGLGALGFPWLPVAIVAGAVIKGVFDVASAKKEKEAAQIQAQAAQTVSRTQSESQERLAQALITAAIILGVAWILGNLFKPRPIVRRGD